MTAAIYGPRPLTEGEQTAVSVTAAAVAGLGLLGFIISFATVAKAAEPSFGWFAWIVPLGIDLGIAVFSALDIVLARLGMRLRLLPVVPWSLTAATVYLNVASEDTLFGIVAHAVRDRRPRDASRPVGGGRRGRRVRHPQARRVDQA